MDIEKAVGPGVDGWLLERVKAWKINQLTDVQNRALAAGVANGSSIVVCSPTSSGKTLIAEITILAALRAGIRTLYLVSHKALADQKYLDFTARFGESAPDPLATVGLNTGDRAEGDLKARVLIATYEKALSLAVTGQLNPENTLVVADELQILGDSGRGPEIETLCALLRRRKIRQFVALTATIENPEDLAGWMRCELVRSFKRDVPLHQEVWYGDRRYRVTFGEDAGRELQPRAMPPDDLGAVIEDLLQLGRGPILVFTETRKEAARHAAEFGQSRPRAREGLALAEQLDLFSEPTESSEQLRENAERKVAFHTADLSPQERQVLEEGFCNSQFDVCFATSTLAAGVNFPFKSIVFPKLTFQWGDRAGFCVPRPEYRNMSGRAGRLGMHEEGFAILLPRNEVELKHANNLVLPENDRLESQLVNLSLRKSILMLVASRLAASFDEVMGFFQNTLYWYQILERNPTKLKTLEKESQKAIRWLAQNGLVREESGVLLVTPLGRATAISGLLPSTAVQLAAVLTDFTPKLINSFDEWIPGLIYAACASDEFRSERPSRFLPYPAKTMYESIEYWAAKSLPIPLDRADTRLAQSAHAISLFIEGLAERKIAFATAMSSGSIHRLATDAAWVLDGLHKLAAVPEIACPQSVGNQIAMLARRVQIGAPAEALDIIRVAARHAVPGLGRQRAMALLAQGIGTIHEILTTAKEKLAQVVGSSRRAQALIAAVASSIGHSPNRLAMSHQRVAKDLGLAKLVDAVNTANGVEYEKAVVALMSIETAWSTRVLDDGNRQNVPDLLIELGDVGVLLECKTCTKSPPLVKKEEAWAVIQKAADFDKALRRVTLGKPAFDETSKKKAAAAHDITLVEHLVFVEGLLRVHSGSLPPDEFLNWLIDPGVAELERLGGTATFSE